jgi:hypothetical protein
MANIKSFMMMAELWRKANIKWEIKWGSGIAMIMMGIESRQNI